MQGVANLAISGPKKVSDHNENLIFYQQ